MINLALDCINALKAVTEDFENTTQILTEGKP